MNERRGEEGPWRGPAQGSSRPRTNGRIERAFRAARGQGRAALIGYLTACDPDYDGSLARVLAACDAGLDVLELGVPYALPSADGPVICDAMERALRSGATLNSVLSLARAVRERCEVPIVLMSYAAALAPVASTLGSALSWAGVDGLLVPDARDGESHWMRRSVSRQGVDWIALCRHEATVHERRAQLAHASGFAYVVSSPGTTGGALDVNAASLHRRLSAVRSETQLPIAVGFGIKRPEQVQTLTQHADAVVIGSALVEAGVRSVTHLTESVRSFAAATRDRSRLSA